MSPSDDETTDGSSSSTATIVLRRRAGLSALGKRSGPYSSTELGEQVGAHPDDLAAVRRAAEQAGLRVVSEHGPSRRVRVEGPSSVVRAWAEAVPDELGDIATAVLAGRGPQASPRSMIAGPHAAGAGFTPPELAKAYGMPDADGTGQTIAIVELGGGFAQSDLSDYFGRLDLPTPKVRAIGVDGAKNEPGKDPKGADGEVLLDIEVAGGIAPGADQVVYFAPNTDAGFLDAVSEAAHADPAPVAISISWGQSEDRWSASSRQSMDDAFADAAQMGITVTAAAGDNGSGDNDSSGGAHADFPASSPHVLGCGGTTLHLQDGTVSSEVVWDDGGKGGATGGGVSDTFPVPAWQKDAGVPDRAGGGAGRGVPDVAAVADPQTGYKVQVDGSQEVYGGTSAVAPLWAGLIARIVQLTGHRVGLAQTALYAGVAAGTATPHLRDITSGSNGAYDAGPGWDACTGLGVPDQQTLQAFSAGDGSKS